MKQLRRGGALFLALASLAACGRDRGDASQSAADSAAGAAAPADTAAMAGMGGMRGMEGMAGMSGEMMQRMRTHMQGMQTMSADSLMKMLPEHRQMAANMLAQMNREMEGMSAGPEWDEAVNAVRQDLVNMPEMSPEELQAYMPRHREHMDRVMEMHRSMMNQMKM